LTIHTNKSGEIIGNRQREKEKEIAGLEKKANAIDSMESPYKVIVSVLMLKEGWDVKNVFQIVPHESGPSTQNFLSPGLRKGIEGA